MPDFFLDEFDSVGSKGVMNEVGAGGAQPRFRDGKDTAETGPSGGVEGTFKAIQGLLNEDTVKKMGGVYLFDLKGKINHLR